MNKDIPVIEGVPLAQDKPASLASLIMSDPSGMSVAAPELPPLTYRPKTIMELLADIPQRTSIPALAELFLFNAAAEFSRTVKDMTPEMEEGHNAMMAAQGGGPEAADWKRIAFEIDSILTEHIEHVNAEMDAEADIVDAEVLEVTGAVRGEIDAYRDAINAHDFSQPLTPELDDMRKRLDPTGDIIRSIVPDWAQ